MAHKEETKEEGKEETKEDGKEETKEEGKEKGKEEGLRKPLQQGHARQLLPMLYSGALLKDCLDYLSNRHDDGHPRTNHSEHDQESVQRHVPLGPRVAEDPHVKHTRKDEGQ